MSEPEPGNRSSGEAAGEVSENVLGDASEGTLGDDPGQASIEPDWKQLA